MSDWSKIASLKSVASFRDYVAHLDLDIPVDDALLPSDRSPLLQPIAWKNKPIGNRIAIHPMEGWDGTTQGGATPAMLRRWQRFGASGAKLIWGCEAMAVRPDGRANPNQLILIERNREDIEHLLLALRQQHRDAFGSTQDLVVGFQLTHSGRYCRPHDHHRWEPQVAHRHPILDAKFRVSSDTDVLTPDAIRALIRDYVEAARLAQRIGADFVDIKSCHGYLLHEFLGAHTRADLYGGPLENRARIILEIIEGIRKACPDLGIGVRLSVFDSVPFEPDPASAVPGKLGRGRPCAFHRLLPYRWGFGINPDAPLEIDLTEPLRCIYWFKEAGVSLLNVTAGSPYYTPHILRPAAFPPSDGYQPHEDPLHSVAKHLAATHTIKKANPELVVLGSGYSYLQEYLPRVAQATVRQGWTDLVGMGRMVLSYPRYLLDAIEGSTIERKKICRTFSDCTTAPRNGMPSGCYPLDDHYKHSPDAERVKHLRGDL